MKTAISLPDDVFMAAEAMVEARGWSRSHLYAQALRQYLKRQDPNEVTAQLNLVAEEASQENALRRKANRSALAASDW
jgi:metal-responsive CopG/Arc/MetJ family transcriptional regulator